MRNLLTVAALTLALLGCSTAVAGEETPVTHIACEGWSGGCGAVFWVERDGVECAIPMTHDGSLAGIDCWKPDH